MAKKQKDLKIQTPDTEIVIPTRGRMAVLPQRVVGLIADELAKTLVKRLPAMVHRPRKAPSKPKFSENLMFLDTSAIIDGRIFDVINLGLVSDTIVILESVLSELKHIADSKEPLKKERGRNGLDFLEKLKKGKKAKILVISLKDEKKYSEKEIKEVDDRLITIAKQTKGKIITCDYNLEKKSTISGVATINMNALAQGLKIRAIPGQNLTIAIQHVGKNVTQGVGYLDDGTMVVVERASENVNQTLEVTVSRVIQTAAGRILFAKKVDSF